MPNEENSPRRHSPAQITDSFTVEPGSISLLGQILTPARMREPRPTRQSSPMTLFSSSRVLFFTVTLRHTIAWRRRHCSPMYECGQMMLLLTLA